LLTYAGFETVPTEIIAASNAFVRVASKPAFFVPIGGYMRFNAPKGAMALEGECGMAKADSSAQAADFRIEEEMPDGSVRTLRSHLANPGDYGLQPFSVPLSGDADHKLILRTASSLEAEINTQRSGATEKNLPLSCWADVRFK
jgi:hypothetical protein